MRRGDNYSGPRHQFAKRVQEEDTLRRAAEHELLRALADCQPEPGAWVSAEGVSRQLGSPTGGGAQSLGQRLSRLAKAGRCQRKFDEEAAMWRYRPHGFTMSGSSRDRR